MPEGSPERIEPDILDPDPEEVEEAYLLRADILYEKIRENSEKFTFSSLGALVSYGAERGHLERREAKEILDEAKPEYSFRDDSVAAYTPALDD